MPTAAIVTTSFTALAETLARSKGYPDLAMVVVQHPIGGLKKSEVGARMLPVIQELLDALTAPTGRPTDPTNERSVGGFHPPRPRLI